MDFGDLILLLILLAPLLGRLFGKKQRPEPAAEHPESPSGAAPGEDPLAEALRQIREALGESEPKPQPVASAPPKPLPAQPRRLPPRPSKPPEFHHLGTFEHDEHGFGRSNPLSEEVFEQRAAASLKTVGSASQIKQKPLDKIDLTTPLEVQEVGTSSRARLDRLLTDPDRAREAFVLTEVLGPPRSRQPRR